MNQSRPNPYFLGRLLGAAANRVLSMAGLEIRRTSFSRKSPEVPEDRLLDEPEWVRKIVNQVLPFTMTSPERIAAVCTSVEYIVSKNIPGDILECGVWRGGSMMAAALTLLQLKSTRHLYLFDTFSGMTPPSSIDKTFRGGLASDLLPAADKSEPIWAIASLSEVQRNIASTNYPKELIHFVEGKVEDTVPTRAPSTIALLRLDTDWYESTKHEFTSLYPRLHKGGVLIIDDYGHWRGAKKAVDEYIDNLPILLHRIDYTGRIAIKQ